MLSLRSGIFAGSLLGSGSCLQRLAPCACRSSRKPSPRKSPKKPFELQRDNISGEQRRLLALTEMGCRCPPRSPKERWFFTNQRIILALAIALDRPPDLVSEFLHSLTLQNFARIIKPPDSVGVSCKVPYVNCYACDNFMRIFDIHGNLRSRYNKDSLKMLLRLVQAVLRQDSQREPREPLDTSFGAQRGALAGDSIAKRAGIDRDSIARQNGKRRMRNSEARAAINRIDFSIGQVEPTIGDPGYVFGSSLDFSDWDDPMYTPEDWLFDDSLTSQRFKRLENLLIQLNEKTYLTRDSDHLITAIRDLNLGRTVTNPPQYTNDKVIVKKISDSYYERVKASASRTLFKKRSTHHIRKRKKSPEEDSMHKVHTDKLYYGAPVPVLMHEPFDREKPWTWLRRHPHQKRMDDTGRVTEGSIHRYRRSTIEQLMQKARERSSVSTVISMDSDRETKSNTQTKFGKKHTRR